MKRSLRRLFFDGLLFSLFVFFCPCFFCDHYALERYYFLLLWRPYIFRKLGFQPVLVVFRGGGGGGVLGIPGGGGKESSVCSF